MLYQFKREANAYLPRDLQEIKRTIGGTKGELSSGGVRVKDVLRVGEGLYVTTNAVPPPIKKAIEVAGADIHTIRNRADLTQFVQRAKVFDGRD